MAIVEERSALLPHRPRRAVAVSIVTVCALAAIVLIAVPAVHSNFSVLLSRTQQLEKYVVTGGLDVPEHPPGMPYVKVPPMGDVQVTDPDGNPIGHVNFKTLPPPPAPPPTIIKFGDVGVAPAGCPMCPVLDVEAVEKQKQTLKENQERLKRLQGMESENEDKIEKNIEQMKALKAVMQESLFNVKEEAKKEDVILENEMLQQEELVGPPGPRGLPGYDGQNGVPGVPGEPGANGRQGKTGAPGAMGPRGIQGADGMKGPEGVKGAAGKVGKDGLEGLAGKPGEEGPVSVTLACERIGGLMFKDICFKGSPITADKDAVPDDCKPWTPETKWDGADFIDLAKMFQTRKFSGSINRGSEGGNCANHVAVASFTQGSEPSKVWVNSQSFTFNPTGSGSSCTLYNGDTTVGVYACSL